MSKNKTFRFSTQITPETEILLNGRSGQPLSISFTDELSSKRVCLDTESIIRLQAFLSEFLQKEESASTAPTYEPTGRALAIMDGDSMDIVRVLRTRDTVGLTGAETESYEDLCDKVKSLTDSELPGNPLFIFFDTFNGSISLKVIQRILRACIVYQTGFIRTGDPLRSRRMTLETIEAYTSIDASMISRATPNVLILAPSGTYTLDSADASLDRPSLFDEGTKKTNGDDCSRKAVLFTLRSLIESEDKSHPYTDDEMSDQLAHMGFVVARRTVSKYRDLLGIPRRSARRASC